MNNILLGISILWWIPFSIGVAQAIWCEMGKGTRCWLGDKPITILVTAVISTLFLVWGLN